MKLVTPTVHKTSQKSMGSTWGLMRMRLSVRKENGASDGIKRGLQVWNQICGKMIK